MQRSLEKDESSELISSGSEIDSDSEEWGDLDSILKSSTNDSSEKHEDDENSSPVIQGNIVIDSNHQSIWNNPKPLWVWPGLKSALYQCLLFPLRILLAGWSYPIVFITNYFLTKNKEHRQPYGYAMEGDPQDIELFRSNIQKENEKKYKGKWSNFNIKPQNDSTFTIPMNAFLLNNRENAHRLHINVHGVNNSANCFDWVAPETAVLMGADQWNMTRQRSNTLESQKVQLRIVIAAAIQSGYTDIRLDGFSYGAGLVRTVYHELMADAELRGRLDKAAIVLHYTARNGYESEGLTAAAHLLGIGGKYNKDYMENGRHAPKVNFFMKIISFVIDELILFDNTLRNQPIKAPIQEKSMNYVANCVVSLKDKKGNKRLVNDGLIVHTNRSNSRRKYGHYCIDVEYEATEAWLSEYQESYKGITRHRACINQTELYQAVNHRIKEDSDLEENNAKACLQRLKSEWKTKKWRVMGGKKIAYAGKEKIVPASIKKQYEVFKEAKKKRISWRDAFFKVRAISKKAAENPTLTRDASTQVYYDNNKKCVFIAKGFSRGDGDASL